MVVIKRNTEYYREYRRKNGGYDYDLEDMIQCLVCRQYFIFLGTHVRYAHKEFTNMKDYKKHFGLDTKRGITAGKFKEVKRETNKGIKNLEAGKKYRFVKGDPRAGKYIRSEQTLKRISSMRKGVKKVESHN